MKDLTIQIGCPNRTQTFTYAEAKALVPVIFRITQKVYQDVEPLQSQLEWMPKDSAGYQVTLKQVQTQIHSWVSKMTRLGVEVKDLGLVDFDSGQGYYCWRYPEKELLYYHGYEEGFNARKPIAQLAEQSSL
jgi:hypothetical protein